VRAVSARGAETVRLVPLSEADMPELGARLWEYWADLGVVPPSTWHERYVRRLAEEQGKSRHTFWGLGAGERVGLTVLRLDPDWVQPERVVGYVAEFTVFRPFRRQGWGRRLFGAAREWFRAQGCSDLELDVLPTNIRAQAFWTAEGFRLAYHRLRRHG
jgi:ribosomal protein S18 acetylase RimI-like enzyme